MNPVVPVVGRDVNESTLIEQAREGDLSAFTALVDLYKERAVHIAYSFVGNFEDAKDIAQEAFIKVYDRLSSFREESRFYTWFYRILVNTCKDFLRKKKLRNTFSFWLGSSSDEALDRELEIADKAQNSRDNILSRELGSQVMKGIATLPFRQRAIFSLRYLQGLSLEEIAESTGLSLGGVKSNLWHAAQKMKNFLSRYIQIGEDPSHEKRIF